MCVRHTLQKAALNIFRIVLFAIVLLILRATVDAVFGEPPAANEELTARIVLRFLLLRYLPDALVVITVMAILARMHGSLPYVQALSVLVVHELLGAAFLFAIGWTVPQSPFWRLDYLVLIVSAAIGTAIGIQLRRRWERT